MKVGNIKLNRQNQCGFTLLEILIALMIFAVLAVITSIGLCTVIRTHEHLQLSNQRLEAVMTAITVIRRDVTQTIVRPVAAISGAQLPAFSVSSRSQFELTRAGYANPMATEDRSSLQRVAYSFHNGKLFRSHWLVLDRAPHTKAMTSVLLNQVQAMTLQFVNTHGQVVDVWSTTSGSNYGLPRALLLHITLKKLGKLSLVLPMRGRGNV